MGESKFEVTVPKLLDTYLKWITGGNLYQDEIEERVKEVKNGKIVFIDKDGNRYENLYVSDINLGGTPIEGHSIKVDFTTITNKPDEK